MRVSWLKQWLGPAKGQSLVEMAITAPILIFMMIGVFEVGWALRGYLILTNVNREITRFAVRPGYMDFSTKASVITSFNRIQEWVKTANSSQLNIDFSPTATGNTTLLVSHLVVDTGYPFDPAVISPTNWNCDATDPADASYNAAQIFTDDDLIVHPAMPNYSYQAMSYPTALTSSTVTTRTIPTSPIDYADLVANTLIPQNNKFNCEIIKKGGVVSANNLVITQMFFEQPQLFGFPLISNPLTDPIPMYAQTTMRLSTAARSSGGAGGSIVANIDTIGPVCSAYPMIANATALGANPSPNNTVIDILEGVDPTNVNGTGVGWVAWNPVENASLYYLKRQLQFPQFSLNDFTDMNDLNDHSLGTGDAVRSWGGVISNTAELEALLPTSGDVIIVPVWSGSGFTNDSYPISRFIKVRFNNANLSANEVFATFLGYADEACP
jgi:hypothetical protein